MSPKKSAKKTPKAKGPSENEIHMKCWQWVQKTHPSLLIFHVANERKANVQYHLKLKRLGVLKGVADFLVFTLARRVAIELKDVKGTQDSEQEQFQKRWERIGGVYHLVRSLEEFQAVISTLMLWG